MATSRIPGSSESCLNPAVSSGVSTSTNNTEHEPGQRWAAVSTRAVLCLLTILLLGSLAQSLLQAQSAYFAGAVTTLGGGFSVPGGVAVDASGNVYLGDFSNSAVKEIMPHGVNFGRVAVGNTSTTLTLYFTFNAADTGITASALTKSAQGRKS